jgi:hypothetical protein
VNDYNCTSDALITGIEGTHNGTYITSIKARCEKSHTITHVGPAGLYLAFDGASSTTTNAGSNGGNSFSASCPAGTMVQALSGWNTLGGKVRSVTLGCAPLLSSGPTTSVDAGGADKGTLDPPYVVSCASQVAGLRGYMGWGLKVGVNGSGEVLSLTLVCR